MVLCLQYEGKEAPSTPCSPSELSKAMIVRSCAEYSVRCASSPWLSGEAPSSTMHSNSSPMNCRVADGRSDGGRGGEGYQRGATHTVGDGEAARCQRRGLCAERARNRHSG